jgi:hypothetical protein
VPKIDVPDTLVGLFTVIWENLPPTVLIHFQSESPTMGYVMHMATDFSSQHRSVFFWMMLKHGKLVPHHHGCVSYLKRIA